MDFYMKDGVIVRSAEVDDKVKKTKKGGGVAAILGLAKDLMDFQSKVNDCCESQDMTEIKSKIESHAESLAKMYEDLLDIAKAGVKSIRESNPNADITSDETASQMDAPPAPATQAERPKQPLMQTPSIPKLTDMGI